jgi:uncharacterized protein (TIGR02453 family)
MNVNKKAYENAKADWEQMVGDVIKGVSKTEPALQDLLPKNCTFRMNRDVRFSKNKEPYKCNFGASIKIGGKKSTYAGYYFHVEPGASFVGGGFYMPEAPVLSKIRQEIDYDLAIFKKIINNKKFTTVYTNGISTKETALPSWLAKTKLGGVPPWLSCALAQKPRAAKSSIRVILLFMVNQYL